MLLIIIMLVTVGANMINSGVGPADHVEISLENTAANFRLDKSYSSSEKIMESEFKRESGSKFESGTGVKNADNQLKEKLGRSDNHGVIDRHATQHVRRKSRQVPLFPSSPIYDSLLARRTFIPSFRMVLLELSLMTLSVYVINAFENMMAAQKKKTRETVSGPDSTRHIENYFHFL